MIDPIAALPSGTALLHIGPHKTGTTAIQSALHHARADLAPQGVRYASRGRHDSEASRYVLGLKTRGERAAASACWEDVVEALNDERHPRRVFSSETLANASDEGAARVVARLSGTVHVAMVARPLATLIPSQYQQLVQRGALHEEFLPWVEAVLGRRDDIETSLFWRRHRLPRQVRRWARLVGADNITVITLAEQDHASLPATFEQLLALRAGTLVGRARRVNRSLNAEEIELLRSWHRMAAAAGLDPAQRRELSAPVTRQLEARPDPSGQRLALPRWAVEEANRIAAQMATSLTGAGVRVIGDLATLSDVRPDRSASTPRHGVCATDL